MSLQDFLLSILGGSLALGPLLFGALEKWAWFGDRDIAAKRWIVALLSGLLGIVAWASALKLGYVPEPELFTPNYVAESIWQYGVLTGFAAFTSATLIHGQVSLVRKAPSHEA